MLVRLRRPNSEPSTSHRTLQQPWWTRCGEKCFSGFDFYQNTNGFVCWYKPNAFVNKTLAFMKTTKSLMILLASIAMLSAEDYGGFSGKTYKSDAPNGRFSVRAHQEKGYYKFNVEIIELTSHTPVLAFDPKARFIGAAWSPDSKLVAIEQNKSTHDSAVSVYSIAQKVSQGTQFTQGM